MPTYHPKVIEPRWQQHWEEAHTFRTPDVSAKPKYYKVRRGDALSSIAARWNTTTDRLREWNNISGNKIRVGQTLLVRPPSREGQGSRQLCFCLRR